MNEKQTADNQRASEDLEIEKPDVGDSSKLPNEPAPPQSGIEAAEAVELTAPVVVVRPHWFWDRSIGFAAYWFKLIVQPILAAGAILFLVYLFGLAQQRGMFTSADGRSAATSEVDDETEYVCPMLCVPPTKQPGRCPVCGMELKARKTSGDSKDIYGLTIDPASRRLSNIHTVMALHMPFGGDITALGRIGYDETSEATISAYIDGRLDELFVDFTGAEVKKGDALALLYSPDLYSAQVALLESKKAMESSNSTRQRIIDANQRLYTSARRRLIEFGVPETLVDSIEKKGAADSRIKIVSPVSGTVVEKLVDEGKYVKTGMPILKIADLSKVWLILEMYPEDAGRLNIGQSALIKLRSQPGREFEGQIAFVDPTVSPTTQTVRVRVVIPNEARLIRVGDFARATIRRKQDADEPMPVIIPRQAVLMSGDDSVAYVETEPGRFEFRTVDVASISGDQAFLATGVKAGEQVVANAAFMVDAAFNMSGKPSLIDPTRAIVKDQSETANDLAEAAEIEKAFSSLSDEDRKLAEAQVICPVTEVRLGTMGMGKPIKVDVNGRPVMVCCEGCRTGLLEEPDKYLAVLATYQTRDDPDPAAIRTQDKGTQDKGTQDKGTQDKGTQAELPQMELPQMQSPREITEAGGE